MTPETISELSLTQPPRVPAFLLGLAIGSFFTFTSLMLAVVFS